MRNTNQNTTAFFSTSASTPRSICAFAAPPAFAQKILVAALASCFSAVIFANPALPQVAAGTATFTQQGQNLIVNNSNKAIINWGSFSIGAGEVTRFVQSGASSSVLNRVTGGDTSQILGQLLSNGKVFVINPNGIAIGGGARIDTAGFIASSLGMSDADFLSGRLRFVAAGPGATVTNEGVIQGNGSLVALIGPRVDNAGTITSSGGSVVLAAGRDIELMDALSPNIRVKFGSDTSNAQLAQVLQRGVISVALPDAGNAVGASVEGGRVVLHSAGNVEVSGTIAAQNTSGVGGRIDVLGQNITVKPTAELDASGQSGGRITVLAQNDAVAQGRYTANGTTGAGGFIETSGLRTLDVTDAVVRASGTTSGTWLLDPFDIEIVSAGVTNNGGPPNFGPTGNFSKILNTQITAALDSGTSVTIETGLLGSPGAQDGIIVVNAPIVATNAIASAATVLRLVANTDIVIAQPITSAGQVQLNSGGGIVVGDTITGRSVNLTANGSAGVQREGSQANDVVMTGALGSTDNLVIVSSGSVGKGGNALRISLPNNPRGWGVNTTTATTPGAPGDIYLQPTDTNFRLDSSVQLATDPNSAQTVNIAHTPLSGPGTLSIYGDITSNDNVTLTSPGTLVSLLNNLPNSRPGVLTAASIRVTVDKFDNPGNVSGAFFDTSAANGNITLSAVNGFNDAALFGVGVAPGTGTVTATATGIVANSIRLSHYGSDLLTSRYALKFDNGTAVAGQTLDLAAETGDLQIDSTAGFTSGVERQNATLRTRTPGKNIVFSGGTIVGNQTNFIASGGNVITNGAAAVSFRQVEIVAGTGGWRLDGAGVGTVNAPIRANTTSAGFINTTGPGAQGNINVDFGGPTASIRGIATASAGTQSINLSGNALRLQGSASSFSTANDDYNITLNGNLTFANSGASLTAQNFSALTTGGSILHDATSASQHAVGATGAVILTAAIGSVGSSATGTTDGYIQVANANNILVSAKGDTFLDVGNNGITDATLSGITNSGDPNTGYTLALRNTGPNSDIVLGSRTINNANVVLTAGRDIRFDPGAFSSASLTLNSNTTVRPGANLTTRSFNSAAPATVFNNGTLVQTGTGVGSFNGSFVNRGILSVSGTQEFRAAAGNYVDIGGTLNLAGGVASFFGGGLSFNNPSNVGTLSGIGTVNGDVNNQTGIVAPGNSPGLLTINGNYTQGAAGRLNIELNGTAAGSGYDRLAVTGNAALGGTVNVSTLGAFTPAATNVFDIMTIGGTTTGSFASANFSGGNNYQGVVSYPANLVRVSAAPPPPPPPPPGPGPTGPAPPAPVVITVPTGYDTDLLIALFQEPLAFTGTPSADPNIKDPNAIPICR